MAKHDEPKLRTLLVEKMLSTGRKMSIREILDELDRRYGITADRKTIFDDVRVISKIMPVEVLLGRYGGYRKVDVAARCDAYACGDETQNGRKGRDCGGVQ